MILACPSCDSRFSVPDEALLPIGRTVRCSTCSHQWFAQIETPEPVNPESEIEQVFAEPEAAHDIVVEAAAREDALAAQEEAPSAEALVASRVANRRQQARGTSGAWMGWTALASVVVVILASAILLADTISEVWPPAKRLYAMINLPIAGPAAGLDIQNIRAHFEDTAAGPQLVIEGDIINLSTSVKAVPKVRVSLNDSARTELTQWVFSATDFNLIPSEIVTFRTSVSAPPDAAVFAALGFSGDAEPRVEPLESMEPVEEAE
jgi:predicted Zn finger-like uncharacterized protein